MPMRGEALTAGRDRHAEALDRRRRPLGRRRRRRPPRRARRRWPPFEERPITDEERGYWAFKPPVQAPLPVASHPGLDHPIDRFLEQARASRGLVAAPRADRRTLVRRAYLDLLGLPPSPDEVDALPRRRRGPTRGSGSIDTLLASPHYGERYGRHWLDVARYADSGRLRVRRPPPQRLALSRLRHPVVQRRHALRPVPRRADRRRRDGRQDRRQPDRHRLPARRAAGAVPREGQPRAPLRLPGRRARRHRQGHAGTDDRAARAATTTSSIRSGRRTTTRCRRRSSATSRPACRWRRRPQADGLPGHQRGARRPARRAARAKSPPSRSRTATGWSWR